MYYKVFHNLTPWAPSDYVNIVIPPHNIHSVHHDFNIRKPLSVASEPGGAEGRLPPEDNEGALPP